MTFTAEIIDAEKALDIGLVNDVVSHDALLERAMILAEKIADKPPEALRMAKRPALRRPDHDPATAAGSVCRISGPVPSH